jgi:hypothetical protein
MEKITQISEAMRLKTSSRQVCFGRQELTLLLNLYGRMVSAGLWRDYALNIGTYEARFSCFERARERPDIQVIKRPELAAKQGQYVLLSHEGTVLKRGSDLRQLLFMLERKLIKVVD